MATMLPPHRSTPAQLSAASDIQSCHAAYKVPSNRSHTVAFLVIDDDQAILNYLEVFLRQTGTYQTVCLNE